MVKNCIKVFARIKKERKEKDLEIYEIKPRHKHEDLLVYNSLVSYQKPYGFRFHKIFDQKSCQPDIFDIVAKPIVNSVLQGFNGTILAYGQTGSGKTYTITGSHKDYKERGIIPRALQDIFSYLETLNIKPTLYISYMEIYNENAYDLLSKKTQRSVTRLEELPKILILKNKKDELHMRNLTVIPVNTEEEAMRLFFYGETNRTIAETPMNEYSSRSHCIFTVSVALREENSIRYSKLNLVDLAGSERVYKSKIVGNTLNEAKNINLSLHFLQQVILALSEEKRNHIPFRNSLMTYILKDSLCGNCLTSMIATLSFDKSNIQETISTCKFTQRVSQVITTPIINEISDPYQEIAILKNEIQELRLKLQNSIEISEKDLSKNDRKNYEDQIVKYLSGSNSKINVEMSECHIQFCFDLLKNEIMKLRNNVTVTNEVALRKKCSQLSEVEELTQKLEKKLEIATILAQAIEQCQKNISLIKIKLSSERSSIQKVNLISNLEYQQEIYRKSLIELKELKNETRQLEFALNRAKTKAREKPLLSQGDCICYIPEPEELCCVSTISKQNFCCDELKMPAQVLCCSNFETNVQSDIEDDVPVLLKPDISQSDLATKSSAETIQSNQSTFCSVETESCFFKNTDTAEFIEFMKTVPLTGDLNVDQEICNFYRNKFYTSY